MPIVSFPSVSGSQTLTSQTHKHRSTFTARFAFLTPEMQADLWTQASKTAQPDFPSFATKETFWRAIYDAWAITQRYPGVVVAGRLIDRVMGMYDVPGTMTTRQLAALNEGLWGIGKRVLVIEEAVDWVPWVYGLAKHQVAKCQLGKLVLDVRRWAVELLVEVVGRVGDLPVVDKDGLELRPRVDVLVGSLWERDAAERVAREDGAEGSVEIVLILDLEVWKFLKEK